MYLTNGAYYSDNNGKLVRVQLESDGFLHTYDADGKAVEKLDANSHVNGWVQIGRNEFIATRTPEKKAKPKKKAVKKKVTKSETKG